MRRHRNFLLALLLLFCLDCAAGSWVKKYEENYHRPRYYNKAHSSKDHVDYNRQMLEDRDKIEKHAPADFNPNVHKSYYVHILYRNSVICAGALISRRMIMTSARCFLPNELDPTYEYKAKYMTVLTGYDIGKVSDREPAQVNAFYMPASKGYGLPHSIALLSLEKKLKRNKYRYIKLYRKIPKPGDQVQMASLDPLEYEIKLVPSKVVDHDRCKEAYANLGEHNIPFGPDLFCVANKPNSPREVCNTRPGDPLLVNDELCAINIYGENCNNNADQTETMDIYYAVRHSIKFVQRATDLLRAFTGTGPFNATNKDDSFEPDDNGNPEVA